MGGEAHRLDRRRQQHGEQLARSGGGARLRAAARLSRRVRAEPREVRARVGADEGARDRGSRGGGGRRARREHRRLGLDGPGDGGGGAAQRVQGVHGGRRADAARRSAGDLPALPPGASRRGSLQRRHRRETVARLGRSGEPAARPEGAARHLDGRMKHTPLHDIHVALGAKMVPYAGFEMPVSYPAGITAEHKAVREHAGLFDVSHMGEFEVTGPDRNAFVQRITCNDVSALKSGQAHYSGILTEQGTFVDDCVVYRFDDKVMLVVNAANITKDWDHMVGLKGGANVRLRDISDETALLAVQGPAAEGILSGIT